MRQLYHVPCRIERGGFSSERSFEISLPNGEILAGMAHVEYLLDREKKPLDEDVPEYGEIIDGFVQCRVLRKESDGVVVEVPSADLIRLRPDELEIIDS